MYKIILFLMMATLVAAQSPSATVTLTGTASDPDLPTAGVLTYEWSKVSGPGDVFLGAPNALVTTARFTVPGVYVMRLTAGDGEALSSDTTSVTVLPANVPPTVDAGPDQTVKLAVVILNWNPSTTEGVDGYYIYRKDAVAPTGARISGLVVGTSWRDTTVERGQVYRYTATATKGGVESEHSNEAVASVPLAGIGVVYARL